MKKKKVLVATMTAALALPLLASPIPTNVLAEGGQVQATQPLQVANVQVKAPFKDVGKNHPYYDIIHEMRDQGIINGYPDGTFKPNQTISRQHAAVLVSRALEVNNLELEPVKKSTPQPKDLPKSHPYHDEIMLLMKADLLEVDRFGNINPNKPLTRGEMAKILATAFDLEVKADYIFEDVVGTGYEEYIKALYSNGVTTGYEDFTFRVDESLTRAHYAVFMYRAMNLDESYEPQPIPKPEPQPKPEPKPEPKPNPDPNWKSPIKYSHLDNRRSEYSKIPKPDGYVAGEHERKHHERMMEILEGKRNFTSSTSILERAHRHSKKYTYEDALRIDAEMLGISYDEYVDIVNYCIDTGELYVGDTEGDTFVVYFDYTKAHIVMSGIDQRDFRN